MQLSIVEHVAEHIEDAKGQTHPSSKSGDELPGGDSGAIIASIWCVGYGPRDLPERDDKAESSEQWCMHIRARVVRLSVVVLARKAYYLSILYNPWGRNAAPLPSKTSRPLNL